MNNTESEYKFLVQDDSWIFSISYVDVIKQCYLSIDPFRTVRVRTVNSLKNDIENSSNSIKSFITIKGKKHKLTCAEYEYEIPTEDAVELFRLCTHTISKHRFHVLHENSNWEIDVFLGDNDGLIIAELEVPNGIKPEDFEFVIPHWAGTNVTEDSRYSNSNLSQKPFNTWTVKT